MAVNWEKHTDYADDERRKRVWQSQPPMLGDFVIWFIAALIIAGVWIGVMWVYQGVKVAP